MNLISREDLKAKIDNGDDFKLVMTLNEWAYRLSHIPGSLNVTSNEQAKALLEPDDDVVVYCSDELCLASQAAYRFLVQIGYKHVRRYAGGLSDRAEAGYPLEGEGLEARTE